MASIQVLLNQSPRRDQNKNSFPGHLYENNSPMGHVAQLIKSALSSQMKKKSEQFNKIHLV